MKYKVIANGTVIGSGVPALKVLNLLCDMLKGHRGELDVKVYYLSERNGEPAWKLENGFKVTV